MDVPITSVARAISALTDRAARSDGIADHMRRYGHPDGPEHAASRAESCMEDARRDRAARGDLVLLRNSLEAEREAAVDSENSPG